MSHHEFLAYCVATDMELTKPLDEAAGIRQRENADGWTDKVKVDTGDGWTQRAVKVAKFGSHRLHLL